MVKGKQVSIARHGIFYEIFFIKHSQLLEALLDLSYDNLSSGYSKIGVFYSSYSYWIKEDDKDTYFIELLNESKLNLENNDKLNSLLRKLENRNLSSLTLDQLKDFNKTYFDELKELLHVLQVMTERLAPNDMLPNLTEVHQEYDRKMAFVIYDAFYKGLYAVHGKITDKLMRFNIIEFSEIFKMMMIFFYGYSFYIQSHTKEQIRIEIKKLFEIYNSQEFLKLFYKIINLKSTSKDDKEIKNFKENLFQGLLKIFELMNADLPKSNIMPKKAEKILFDDTLI